MLVLTISLYPNEIPGLCVIPLPPAELTKSVNKGDTVKTIFACLYKNFDKLVLTPCSPLIFNPNFFLNKIASIAR